MDGKCANDPMGEKINVDGDGNCAFPAILASAVMDQKMHVD